MRGPRAVPTAAEIEARRVARIEMLGIGDGAVGELVDAPVYGDGPPPEPDGEFSSFELEWRRRIFVVMLGIGESDEKFDASVRFCPE